jgi:hypothetical protein
MIVLVRRVTHRDQARDLRGSRMKARSFALKGQFVLLRLNRSHFSGFVSHAAMITPMRFGCAR